MSCISTKTTKYHLTPGGPKIKMRRSMSVNDMNKLTLTTSQLDDSYQGNHRRHQMSHSNEYDDDDDDDEEVSISKLTINVTYDKSLNSSESQEKLHVTEATATTTHSSPIIPPPLSILPRLPVELDQINKSLRETLDKLLAKEPETRRLKESVLNSRKDKRQLFALLNENYSKCVRASSISISSSSSSEQGEGIEATSTSDALDFLELSESVQMCLDF